MNSPSILIEDLHYVYPDGNAALRGIHLRVEAGERLAILGHNGAGKTTLARHLNRLLVPTRGKVWIGSQETRHATVEGLSHIVGYVFQNPDDQLFAKTIRKEVAFGPRNLGYPAQRVNALVEDALKSCGLETLADRHPFDISYSKRRWVAIASVLAMDTPILVFDEPTAGQDARGLERLKDLLEELHRRGKTILTVSHDLAFCAENFERALVLKNGRVILDGGFHSVVQESSLLEEAGLKLPQVTQLADALRLPGPILKMADFLPEYRAVYHTRLNQNGKVEHDENPGAALTPRAGSSR